jgi:hypothetical protein
LQQQRVGAEASGLGCQMEKYIFILHFTFSKIPFIPIMPTIGPFGDVDESQFNI